MTTRADVIVANRSYVDHQSPRSADVRTPPASGGLLAAVRPVIAPWENGQGTTWIGAGRGRFDQEWCDAGGIEILSTPNGDLRHRRLFFDDALWRSHYALVANSFLWPLLHLVREPLPARTKYYPAPQVPSDADWDAYASVNASFAEAALQEASGGASCWIHDYQLALVPRAMRDAGFEGKIGFFLHTPFPALAVARPYLGDRGLTFLARFVDGMLGAHVVGLQSVGDVARFKTAAVELCEASEIPEGLIVDGRRVCVRALPVGIDVQELTAVAAAARRPDRLASLPPDLPLVVGLERDDYTKGIPERLLAVGDALRSGARFAYVGVAAPTRAGVPAYERLAGAIDEAAADAARAADESGVPFTHLREMVDWSEVVGLQREADVVFTSSLADGLNLVPIQAAVAQAALPEERRSVLIAGRDAGVSSVYRGFAGDGLVAVDPLDREQMARTLCEALAGRPGRVSDRLVAEIGRNDARAWATKFLTELEATC
jgi:trehalose-6-phosphate synthase